MEEEVTERVRQELESNFPHWDFGWQFAFQKGVEFGLQLAIETLEDGRDAVGEDS